MKRAKNIHLIGIGGSGMSGIAVILKKLGFNVSGSDIEKTEITRKLEKTGIKVYYGHSPKNIKDDVECVVISSAIKDENIELVEALNRNIPVIKRAHMLHEIVRFGELVAVSGTHGKTTTSWLCGSVLKKFNPTVIVGGILKSINTNAKIGSTEFFVIETDESDRSFLKFDPDVSVITNIDDDHLDTYGSTEELKKAFIEFAHNTRFYGYVVISDEVDVVDLIQRKKIIYGLKGDLVARNIDTRNSSFDVYYRDRKFLSIKLKIYGMHNIKNVLASVAAGMIYGVNKKEIKGAVEGFKGVKRRIEFKGYYKGIKLYDDYAHHPTEILNTLRTIHEIEGVPLTVIFQPHRYSRTKLLYKSIASSLNQEFVKRIYLMDIYPAGEKPIDGVSTELIYNELKNFKDTRILKDTGELLAESGVIVTLGAGDVYKIAEKLREELSS